MTDGTGWLPEAATDSAIKVLVIDDAAINWRMTGAIIEQHLGWRVSYAEDGAAALAGMERETPRMLLTDLRMPGIDGLERIAAVRRQFPFVPIVLMTTYGNEEIAIQALRERAASYVPMKSQDRDLVPTLEQVVAAAKLERHQQQLLERLSHTESSFVLDNDRLVIPALVGTCWRSMWHRFLLNGTADSCQATR